MLCFLYTQMAPNSIRKSNQPTPYTCSRATFVGIEQNRAHSPTIVKNTYLKVKNPNNSLQYSTHPPGQCGWNTRGKAICTASVCRTSSCRPLCSRTRIRTLKPGATTARSVRRAALSPTASTCAAASSTSARAPPHPQLPAFRVRQFKIWRRIFAAFYVI